MVVLGGGAVSYERGTPVAVRRETTTTVKRLEANINVRLGF